MCFLQLDQDLYDVLEKLEDTDTTRLVGLGPLRVSHVGKTSKELLVTYVSHQSLIRKINFLFEIVTK